MAREARQKGWWQSSALPRLTQIMVGLEQAATTVRQFELALMPGMLQTSDYARVLMTTLAPTTPIDVLENLVAARMIRQHVLTGADPLTYEVILSEAVLRCPVGGNRVMRGQLERLQEAASQPNITIQVLPFAAGPHPGMEGAFTLLTLPNLAHDVVYVEGPPGAIFLEEQDHVRRCTMYFAVMSSLALSAAESADIMSRAVWRKSSCSGGANGGGTTECVEVAALGDDRIAVRDSKHPDGAALFLTRAELAAWISGVKTGEF
jgi:Domain of unknown function (DUF5753)/Domain of unknown function (DUF397)